MDLFGTRINDITDKEINRLIENSIPESKILDYKKELKIDTGDERKEFLFDIASFANSEGGIIIFGIEEKKDNKGNNTGLTKEISGIEIDNDDKLILKIEDLVKNNLEPQISSLEIKILKINDKHILLIGIPKLIDIPHMVTFKSSNKFYKRRNNGKILMDVYDLKNVFLKSYELKEKINEFRLNRIYAVRELKYLPKLDVEGSFFLHVIPFGSGNDSSINISSQTNINYLAKKLGSIRVSGWDYRHNLDGFMTFSHDLQNRIPFSYVQLFRNGALEYYTSHFHYKREGQPEVLDFAGLTFEKITVQKIKESFDVLKFFKIEPPYVVYISIFDLDEGVILTQDGWRDSSEVIGKKELILPDMIFNDLSFDIAKKMQPIFDILWQAGNYPKSPFFDDNGNHYLK